MNCHIYLCHFCGAVLQAQMSGQGMHGVGATSMSRSALETEIAALKQQVSYSSKQELPYQLRQLSIHMHIKDNTPPEKPP